MRCAAHITTLAAAPTCSCTAGGGSEDSRVAFSRARGAAAAPGPNRCSDASLGTDGVPEAAIGSLDGRTPGLHRGRFGVGKKYNDVVPGLNHGVALPTTSDYGRQYTRPTPPPRACTVSVSWTYRVYPSPGRTLSPGRTWPTQLPSKTHAHPEGHARTPFKLHRLRCTAHSPAPRMPGCRSPS